MKAKTVGETQYIELPLVSGKSVKTVATITVVGEDGRKARCWVGVVLTPNGRARFSISTLGRTQASDRTKSAVAAWHDDLT